MILTHRPHVSLDPMCHSHDLPSADDITIDCWWHHKCITWCNNYKACMWKSISNSLDINFIQGLSCKKLRVPHAFMWSISPYSSGLIHGFIPSPSEATLKNLGEIQRYQVKGLCQRWSQRIPLTHNKQLEMHRCIPSTVSAEAQVLKHQATSIHSADKITIVSV